MALVRLWLRGTDAVGGRVFLVSAAVCTNGTVGAMGGVCTYLLPLLPTLCLFLQGQFIQASC